MKLVDNPEFWNDENIIKTQSERDHTLYYYEEFLVSECRKINNFKNILCVGAGTGREVYGLHTHFPEAKILANDIAENMIAQAIVNFKNWGISEFTDTLVAPIEDMDCHKPTYDFICLLNNIMDYVIPSSRRDRGFKKIYEILEPEGAITGVVHNIYGTPQKIGFFLLSSIFNIFSKREFGDKITGWEGKKFLVHYFSRSQVYKHLVNAGFKDIKIYTLEDLNKMRGKKYNRLKGDNNLLFIARKP
jgi:ubiquinone/menaquinone biosynthesis C-methylase UbiE